MRKNKFLFIIVIIIILIVALCACNRDVVKSKPSFSIEITSIGKEEVNFNILIDDPDGVGKVSKIELLHKNDETIVAMKNDIRSFKNLMSSNDYTLKVTYSYDLQDKTGEHVIIKTTEFKTKSKSLPLVSINNVDTTINTFVADVEYVDEDNVGEITSIVLKKDNDLVAVSNEKSHIIFDNLESDTEYSLVVTYKYDLNDGNGVQTATLTTKNTTKLQFDFVKAVCVNTSAINKGDNIYIEIALNNPSKVVVDAIKINGTYYAPYYGSTSENVIVCIPSDNNLDGGIINFQVTEIKGTHRENQIFINLSDNNTVPVFINGDLFVESICVVDENGNECDMAVYGKQSYIKLKLINKSNYDIDSITIDSTTYTKANKQIIIDDYNTIRVPFITYTYGTQCVTLSQIVFGNALIGNKSMSPSNIYTIYTCVKNETPVIINDVEQLKNLEQNTYYVLENDLDLTGIEWKDPGRFLGYLDGQGHSIKNMCYVGSIADASFDWGLFKYATGVIKNLTITGKLMLSASLTSDNIISRVKIGGLCAESDYLTLYNIVNNINIVATYDNDLYTMVVGGFVGRAYKNVLINYCKNNGNISCSRGSAGGFIGDSSVGTLITIKDGNNAGDVSGAHASEFVGEPLGIVIIENCTNTGLISKS